jgi:hypothetical protein
VACGLEHVGVHDNMSHIQAQNHQCDGGGCQQGSELTFSKGLGANLVVTPGVVEENTTCILEANHMDHVERSTNTGSQGTRKHRRRNLNQVLSDEENEDNVASPPTKKCLIFKISYEYVAAVQQEGQAREGEADPAPPQARPHHRRSEALGPEPRGGCGRGSCENFLRPHPDRQDHIVE